MQRQSTFQNLPSSLSGSRLRERKYYTVVGSRKAPKEAIEAGEQWIKRHVQDDVVFRSGNATGFDQTVNCVAPKHKEIYLPFRNFGPHFEASRRYLPKSLGTNYNRAKELVYQYHPLHENVSEQHLPYLIRDIYQVLGADCETPSERVICWTADGAQKAEECTRDTGGTAMAIRIADAFGIPVTNLERIEKQPKQVYLDKMDDIEDDDFLQLWNRMMKADSNGVGFHLYKRKMRKGDI